MRKLGVKNRTVGDAKKSEQVKQYRGPKAGALTQERHREAPVTTGVAREPSAVVTVRSLSQDWPKKSSFYRLFRTSRGPESAFHDSHARQSNDHRVDPRGSQRKGDSGHNFYTNREFLTLQFFNGYYAFGWRN